jgi:cobalt-zinc-cadmium efflux system protein
MATHHHEHAVPIRNLNKAFIFGLSLNLIYVFLEAGAGFYSGSLGLLTDAGHNLSDVVSLALALLAYKLAKIKPTEKFTYGYQKTTILVALVNAVILLVAIGGIGLEAFRRLHDPEPMPGKLIAWVAGAGIIINTLTALLFFKDKNSDLNVKGAYLHMAADALVSVGVVVSGIVMLYTGWYWLDTLISFVIMIVIFLSTWNLLKETVRLSLDAVPENIDFAAVQEAIVKVPGVKKVNHIHIWAISTTRNALTAQIQMENGVNPDRIHQIKEVIRHDLEHLNLDHLTLETDFEQTDEGSCAV